MSTILTSRMVNSRIEQPIRSIPKSALSLGIPILSRSMPYSRKFPFRAEHILYMEDELKSCLQSDHRWATDEAP